MDDNNTFTVKIDPNEVNAIIAKSVLESTIGDQIKNAINGVIKNIST